MNIDDTNHSIARGPWGLGPTLGISLLIALSYLGMQALTLVLFTSGYAAFSHAPDNMMNVIRRYEGLILSLSVLASAPAGMWLILFFIRKRGEPPPKMYLALYRFNFKQLAIWGVLLAVLLVASDALTRKLGRPVVPTEMIHVWRTAIAPPLLWIAIVLAAPLFEECFFRGFLFRGIEFSRLGPDGAIIITSLAWALIHRQYDNYEMAIIFIMGLLLGYARARTGSILLTFLLHAANNSIALAQIYYLVEYAGR